MSARKLRRELGVIIACNGKSETGERCEAKFQTANVRIRVNRAAAQFGEEAGFAIGIVNYPRFPSSPSELHSRAREIARALVVECCQRTALVVGPETTEWILHPAPGERP